MSLPTEAETADTLGNLVLARIASARTRMDPGLDKGVIAADLAPFAGPQMPASQWRRAVEATIERLTAAELIAAAPGGLEATERGAAAAARVLGAPPRASISWSQMCNLWLIAKALGVRRTPARRLAALATADGLRAAILVHAYGLSIKGEATPARLRQALAAAALRRAFGGQGKTSLADKLGLSARASRLLAGQLLDRPRDPGTDRRLVAALAAQACGAPGVDLPALRAAVLRRFFTVVAKPSQTAPPPAPKPAPKPSAAVSAPAARSEAPQPARPPAPSAPVPGARPIDLPGFASEVRRCAAGEAQGWAGDRKAYISRVWRSLREQRPEWGLSEIEFKGMLAEAHRAGQLALANADLKDASNIKDVQDSALSYKNAVFHFIRVDA